MKVVVALGGNALLKRGEPMTADAQRGNVRVAAEALARVAREHQLVISHGNGPQVGLLALEAAAYEEVEPYPFDVLGAETQGMIGYLIEQELGNYLPFEVPLATILTMVEVDPEDAGLAREVVATVPVTRTVEGDLGMRWSAVPTVAAAREAGLEVDEVLEAAAARRRADPSLVPVTADEAAEDFRLAAAAVTLAIRRHAGRRHQSVRHHDLQRALPRRLRHRRAPAAHLLVPALPGGPRGDAVVAQA